MAMESYFTTYSKVFSSVKEGRLPQAVLLYGPEFLLRKKFLEQFRESFQNRFKEAGETEIVWADDPDSLTTLMNLLNVGGLFSQARLVIVRGLENWSRQLANSRTLRQLTQWLENPAPDTYLILSTDREPPFPKWLEALRKLCTEVPVRKPWPNEVQRIIYRMAAWRDKQLEPAAAQALQEIFDGDLAVIDQELEKIALALEPQVSRIGLPEVQRTAGMNGIASLETLLQAFEARQPKEFLKALVSLVAGGKTGMTYLIVRLYHEIMSLMAIKLGLPPEGRLSQRQRAAASRYSLNELKGALVQLADLDRRLRLGNEEILDNFLPWVTQWMRV